MTIYKFRVMYEEDDAIFRDIEIKPSQTLSDFETVIASSYNLPLNSSGQFFRSNDNWQRLKQIAQAVPAREEKKGKSKARAQTLPILVAYIDDPHQKFIYEYHGSQEFTFLIELVSLTISEKPSVIYPVCVKQQGPSPFKKEELVAHYSKTVQEDDEEEQAIDDEEDDLDAMSQEGGEEDILAEASTEDHEESSTAEKESESEADFLNEEDEEAEEEPSEGFGEEEFGEGFSEEADDEA